VIEKSEKIYILCTNIFHLQVVVFEQGNRQRNITCEKGKQIITRASTYFNYKDTAIVNLCLCLTHSGYNLHRPFNNKNSGFLPQNYMYSTFFVRFSQGPETSSNSNVQLVSEIETQSSR